ncbi:hypothetical protein PV325_004065 [Microctonus aethiopoides]|uniref:Crooked neck protein n=1 Tax=Microctonus aethiopoides TaxID=144406 RepID=A0AA39FWQ2_9HYME|nr:hypothetical protein PV325_004065 [Microctonus aethiopoides]KAK0177257.1 hypothetical protein PV328_001329 [Microctonus aethiopoides]
MNIEKQEEMLKIQTVQNKIPVENCETVEKPSSEVEEKENHPVPQPKQKASDLHVLLKYQRRKRKEFEANIQKNRMVVSNWTEYAQWEEEQKFISRARLIYERALDIEHCNVTIWLKYIEMEERHRQIPYARNLLDRLVSILPRVSQFWYKYVDMEENYNNDRRARIIYERWMAWEPEDQAWQAYINFEIRQNKIERARHIYERFIIVHPDVKNWLKYARFETTYGRPKDARSIYERAINFYDRDAVDEKLYIAYAKFEEGRKHTKKACLIYEYGLYHTPKEKSEELSKAFEIFKRKHGDGFSIRNFTKNNAHKKKSKLEELVKKYPYKYINWFDYLKIIESEGNHEVIRQTYEKAVSYKPSKNDTKSWREYIYLWINYAVFEELETKDIKRSRRLYKSCLDLIPNEMVIFTKVWLYYAEFEVRQKNLLLAREALGRSLGIFSNKNLSEKYMQMKLQFEEYDEGLKEDESFLNKDLRREVGDDETDTFILEKKCERTKQF